MEYTQTTTPQVVGYAAAGGRLVAVAYPAASGWVGLIVDPPAAVLLDADRGNLTRRLAAALRRRGWRPAGAPRPRPGRPPDGIAGGRPAG